MEILERGSINMEKRFEGIWNASAEKRYKHFKSYVADQGSVWVLSNQDGFTTIDLEGYINLLVWPSKEFAVAFDAEETPVEIEVHDFCQRCEAMIEQSEIRFMVFPNDKDTYIVETEELLNDILDELDLIE